MENKNAALKRFNLFQIECTVNCITSIFFFFVSGLHTQESIIITIKKKKFSPVQWFPNFFDPDLKYKFCLVQQP